MGEQDNNDGNANPSYQDILDQLPESLHGVVKPHLEKMDKGLQKRVEDIQSQYNPYKGFVEQGIDPSYIEGALNLAQQFQQNPDAVIEQANKAFNLNYSKVDPNANNGDEDDDLEDYDGVDISNHPAFKQITEQLSELQQGYQTREQQEQQERAQQEYEDQLEQLHTGPDGERVEFNDLFVTALVSQGAKPEEAVQAYQNLVKSEVEKIATPGERTKETPPVVMGGAGTVGSGVPDQSVDFSSMKEGDVLDLVANMVQQANAEDS